MTAQKTRSDELLLSAHRQMESALAALDQAGERSASLHLDRAIAILGLRTPMQQATLERRLANELEV
jgi:hypothetical protein